MPPTIGSFLDRFADPVRCRMRSDSHPPLSTPADAPMYGSDVINPAWMNVIPRAVTR